MIKIYNKKTNNSILIDESLDWVQLMPMLYLDKPFLKIEMEGFYFGNHAESCLDCKSFIESFGVSSNHWFLEYNSVLYLIDTENIGIENSVNNELKQVFSDYFNGTILTLSLFELDKTQLRKLELQSLEIEDYESACKYRDLLKEI